MRYTFTILLLLTVSFPLLADSFDKKPLSELVFYPQRSAPAEVIAKHDSALAVEVSGVVNELMVDVGDMVKKGDTLLKLNDYNYRQIVTQVEATLAGLAAQIELAQYQLQQAQRLAKQNNISEELQRQRRAELAVLRSEKKFQEMALSMAKYNVRSAVLSAPFDGVVVERYAQLGQLVDQSVPLLRLVSVGNRLIEATVARDDAVLLQKVTEQQLKIGEQRYQLKRVSLLPVVDNKQRTQRVRFEFIEEGALVGSSGRLLWRDPRPHLPASYLVRREQGLGVQAANNGGDEQFVAFPQAQEGRAVSVEMLNLDAQIFIEESIE